MGTVGHRLILPLLALLLMPATFSVPAPNLIQTSETPTILQATIAPTERLAPPVIWLNTLQFRLTAYFTKKYPAYDFSPYTRELERIRRSLSLGDRWGAKREMGVFLSMLASRAYQNKKKLCLDAKASGIFTSGTTGENHAGCSKMSSSKAALSELRTMNAER